jgi:Protein of unknown function (DUF2844)
MVKTRLLAFVVLSLLTPLISRAQLAQPEQISTRQLSSLHLQKSESHSADGFRYTLFSSDDLVVKQYVNPITNKVFGVTWRGKRMPNLLTLLGFDPYKIAGPGVSRSLHATCIRTEHLSINIIVLMGHYSGSAIRADLVPQGVSGSAVRP